MVSQQEVVIWLKIISVNCMSVWISVVVGGTGRKSVPINASSIEHRLQWFCGIAMW